MKTAKPAMKTAMKVAMKAKKVAPAMKKAMKVMKAKKIASGKYAKAMVLRGTREKTVGGLTAKDIIKNKKGRLVSKSRSMLMKKNPWNKACVAARKALKIKGFVAFNKGPEGKALYDKAKEIYAA